MAVLEEKITMLDKKIMALDKKIDNIQKSIEGLKCFKARKKKEPSAYAKYIQKFFNHPEVSKLDGKERMKYLAQIWQSRNKPLSISPQNYQK